MIVGIAKQLVESAEKSDFFDKVYDTKRDWEFDSAEGTEDEGYIYFTKVVESGYTQGDVDVTVEDTEINIEEFAEMFDIKITATIHYYSESGMMYFDTNAGDTSVEVKQTGIEDVQFDEEKNPEAVNISGIYEKIEKEIANLPESDPQDVFDVSFDSLLVDTVKEYSNER